VGELAEALGIGQPTVSHHVRKLADVGFVSVHKDRTSTVVTVTPPAAPDSHTPPTRSWAC